MVNKLFERLLSQFAPCVCELCGQPSARPVPLCQLCEQALPVNHLACPCCALPECAGLPCGQCQQHPPPFSTTVAPFLYTRPLDGFIKHLKFSGDLRQLPLLAELMSKPVERAIRSEGKPDALVPVPLHWRRQWQRGFNQATLLARQLCRHRDLRPWSLRVRNHLCVRRRATPAQAGLDSASRRRNIRNAFSCTDSVAGQHLVIIDDVMTTGSTVAAVALELLHHGARRVDVWCCARTPAQGP